MLVVNTESVGNVKSLSRQVADVLTEKVFRTDLDRTVQNCYLYQFDRLAQHPPKTSVGKEDVIPWLEGKPRLLTGGP